MISRSPLVSVLAWPALALSLAACAPTWEPAFHENAPPGMFDDVAIADGNDALTFARTREQVILVDEYRAGRVRGVALGAALGQKDGDPITLFNQLGYERLRDFARSRPASARVDVAATDLEIPVGLRGHHVAAATNFPEHAGDAGVDDGPFLFAKIVEPTGPYAEIPAGDGLLDYEVEVAWVALEPAIRGGDTSAMGLILCNDVTDRAALMRHLDPWNVASGDGFTTGKSFRGYLPVGNLFVIPRDHRGFIADIQLRLYVNGGLRQRSSMREMVWDYDEILARTWAARNRRWEHGDTEVSLLGGGDAIRERSMLLSGTPHGTVFDGLAPRHYAAGVGDWLMGGWDRPLTRRVIEAYIGDARNAGAYLRPGDRVEIHVDRLGILRNRVAGSPAGSSQAAG